MTTKLSVCRYDREVALRRVSPPEKRLMGLRSPAYVSAVLADVRIGAINNRRPP
jgi:hypothetical protein